MNYKRIYESIIDKAKSEYELGIRYKGDGKYYEWHHIVPRCLGGSDNKSNLALLTAKEHFLCHMLLYKLHPSHSGIIKAIYMMRFCHKTERYITGLSYDNLRRSFAKTQSDSSKGKKLSQKHKDSISSKLKGNKNLLGKTFTISENYRKAQSLRLMGSNNPMYGKIVSQETRDKISEAGKGRVHSEETRKQMSLSATGKSPNEETRNKLAKIALGKRCFNNGIINKMAYECPEGFVSGRLRKN